jgi:hypothetical protein
LQTLSDGLAAALNADAVGVAETLGCFADFNVFGVSCDTSFNSHCCNSLFRLVIIPEFNLPRLDDKDLGYDDEDKTVENEMPLGQKAGEIVSGKKGGEKTVLASRVELGGEETRISPRPSEKTQFVDFLASLGEDSDDDGKNDETAIINLPKRKN